MLTRAGTAALLTMAHAIVAIAVAAAGGYPIRQRADAFLDSHLATVRVSARVCYRTAHEPTHLHPRRCCPRWLANRAEMDTDRTKDRAHRSTFRDRHRQDRGDFVRLA